MCSGGQRARILLARALMAGSALLLDEPFDALDPAVARGPTDAVGRLAAARPGLTTITVTHHLEELSPAVGHVLLLRAGRTQAAGPVEAVLTGARLTACFGRPIAVAPARRPPARPFRRPRAPGVPRVTAATRSRLNGMEYRHLGRSGLVISEIAYGNWLTHGSQVEEDAATACVRAALEQGITTFDTADVYAGTRAESVLGRALKGQRREGLEIFTKVFWPTGEGRNDRGLSRKHIMESVNASLTRLQTDYVDLYQAHRFDRFTPLEETMEAFADVVHSGKAHYIGVSEWTADQIRAAHHLARELRIPLVSSQPQYSMLWRVIEGEVVPACEDLGIGQIVWSPIAQGVLTGKYRPGQQPPAGSRATDDKGGANMISRWMTDEVLERVQRLQPLAEEAGLSLAQLAIAWVLQNSNVSAAIIGASRPEQVAENVKAAGVKLDVSLMERIDEVIAPVAVTDPAKTYDAVPSARP